MNELTDLHAIDLIDASWHKSTYTAGEGNCVEVADIPGTSGIAVRDSKNTDFPASRFSRPAWSTFVTAIAVGTLD